MTVDQSFSFSVVVIGRNEGDRLVRCLRSVLSSRHPAGETEIIYVDSGSTDNSRERAAALGAKVISIPTENASAAAGRNAGWKAARFPFVLFLDGDTILDPDFVEKAAPLFDDARVSSVSGRRKEIRPEASWYIRALDLDWMCKAGPADYCGGDTLFRRSVLSEIGGYDESLRAGEEPEMCWRVRRNGHVVLRVDFLMTLHDLAITRWVQYWRRAERTGYAYAEVSKRFRNTNDPLWLAESKSNLVKGGFWIAFPFFIAAGSIVSGVPFLVGGILFLAAILLRTAFGARWRTRDNFTLMLYAIHSHLQHVPIFFGQWRYRLSTHRGGPKSGFADYKEAVR